MKDKLGQEIKEGNIVVAPRGLRDLALCRVNKINAKTLRLVRIDKILADIHGGHQEINFLARPGDVILVDPVDALAYKLK